ncbi:MAG TPA: CBS domain-containing protein [Terriglobales bacterium]|nr:CBS domain-containing protein [Terriglobales bacterium]
MEIRVVTAVSNAPDQPGGIPQWASVTHDEEHVIDVISEFDIVKVLRNGANVCPRSPGTIGAQSQSPAKPNAKEAIELMTRHDVRIPVAPSGKFAGRVSRTSFGYSK